MPELSFAKMHGQGNDFVVLDGIAVPQLDLTAAAVRALADRHCGIGADQVLLVSNAAQRGEFNYRIFNADGSEVNQCGNGARSVLEFLQRRQYCAGRIVLRTRTGTIEVQPGDTGPRAFLAVPRFAPSEVPYRCATEQRWYEYAWQGRNLEFAAVNLGNPHAVLWVDDVDELPLAQFGADLNRSDLFPEGVNVSVASCDATDVSFTLRVYERGVGLTLACGSAACACAVIARRELGKASAAVTMPGGVLQAGWDEHETAAWIEGEVSHVFDGSLDLDKLAG